MIGPVLYLEMLLGSRRGRQYIFRWLYAGWLVLQLSFFWLIYWVQFQSSKGPWGSGRPDWNAAGEFAGSFVELFVVQQLILLLLVTPAFSAGAITDEKTRGTLLYMLTADLTAWEIVIGKLLGRIAQVAVLVLVGLPVLCFIGVFGGLQPVVLLAVLATTFLPIVALGSASVLASVWSRQTRDAVRGLYTLGGLGYLVVWGSHQLTQYFAVNPPASGFAGFLAGLAAVLDGVLCYLHPLYVLEPAWGSQNLPELGRRLFLAFLFWGGGAGICLGLSVWRLRRAYLKQLEASGKKTVPRWWRAQRRRVAADPIRWRTQYVEGLAPTAILRQVPRWIGVTLVSVTTVLASGGILWAHLPADATFGRLLELIGSLDLAGLASVVERSPPSGESFYVQSVVAILIATLAVGIRCSGAICGERESQSWEALLLVPLETKQLVRGKMWGIIGATYPYLLAYAAPAISLSMLGGFWALFWTVLGLGVLWLGMYFVAAAGIRCSVKAKTSWRSLLSTLGFAYVGGFLIWLVTSPVIAVVAFMVLIVLALVDAALKLGYMSGIGGWMNFYFEAFQIASSLVLAAACYFVAWWFIADAERYVSDRERTRHWKDEPIYRPRRRRVPARVRPYR